MGVQNSKSTDIKGEKDVRPVTSGWEERNLMAIEDSGGTLRYIKRYVFGIPSWHPLRAGS